MLTLVRLSGPRKDESLPFDLPVLRLGRGKTSDLPFDREKERVVSNNHAEIRLEQGLYVLYDLQSTHGTFVNGQKISRAPLYEGDIIGLGQNIGGPTLRFSRRTFQTQAAPMPDLDEVEHTAYKASYQEPPGFTLPPEPGVIPEATVAVRRSPANARPDVRQTGGTPPGHEPSGGSRFAGPPPGLEEPMRRPPPSPHDPAGSGYAGPSPLPELPTRQDFADSMVHTIAHHPGGQKYVPGGLREETVAATAGPPSGTGAHAPNPAAPPSGTGPAGYGGSLNPGAFQSTGDASIFPPGANRFGETGNVPASDANAAFNQSDMFRNLGPIARDNVWSRELSEAGLPRPPLPPQSEGPPPGALLEDVAPPSALTQQLRALRWQLQQLGQALKPWFSLQGLRWLFQKARTWIKQGERPAPGTSAQATTSSSGNASSPASARPNPERRQTASNLRRIEQLEVDELGLRKPFILEDALKEKDVQARWSLPRFVITVGLIFGSPYIMHRYGEQIWHVFNNHPEELVPVISGRPLDAPPIDPPGAANAELKAQVEELSRRQALLPPIPTSRAGKTLQFLRPVLFGLGEDVSFVPRELVADVRTEVAATVRRKDYLLRYRNMARYRPQIVQALARVNLPEGFSFIPWAVSGYSPELRQPDEQRYGLWGLTPEIAERHGLSTNKKADERLDARRSTDAAVSYLLELVGEVRCQSFTLALAAYLEGPQEARRLLARQSTWRIEELNLWHFLRQEYLPADMRTFLVKVLAGGVIAESPEQYDLPQEEDE